MTGIGVSVALMVSAQVMVISDGATWFPFTSPALCALGVHAMSLAKLTLVVAVAALFGALTLLAWATLQLDR